MYRNNRDPVLEISKRLGSEQEIEAELGIYSMHNRIELNSMETKNRQRPSSKTDNQLG